MTEPMNDVGEVRILLEAEIATLILDHPRRLNAISRTMYEQLRTEVVALDDDTAVRVVVVRGAGDRAFSTGSDIRLLSGLSSRIEVEQYEELVERALGALARCRTPTIAEIDGFAFGGGLHVALACDLRVCSSRSTFAVPAARGLGNVPSMAFVERLVAAAGPTVARRLLLGGETLTGAEALEHGLVTHVVQRDELRESVASLAEQISRAAPLALRALKEMLLRVQPPAVEASAIVNYVYASRDFSEGLAARRARRPPVWRGR